MEIDVSIGMGKGLGTAIIKVGVGRQLTNHRHCYGGAPAVHTHGPSACCLTYLTPPRKRERGGREEGEGRKGGKREEHVQSRRGAGGGEGGEGGRGGRGSGRGRG
eukprot:1488624-Rhodomonas_salina.2